MLNESPNQSDKLYFLGMFFLVASLSLCGFAFYIFPHLLFGWHYSIPEFISTWQSWFYIKFSVAEGTVNLIILMIFLIAGLLMGYLANKISHRVEIEEDPLLEQPIIPKEKHTSESVSFFLKIFLLCLVIFAATMIFELLIEDKRQKPSRVVPRMIIPNEIRG